MKTLLNNTVSFKFDNLEFKGLAFSKYMPRPYSSKKEAKEYISKLYNEGTEESKALVKQNYKMEIEEKLHINMSWYYIIPYLSVLLGFIALLLYNNTILSYSIMGISFIVFLSRNIFDRKIKQLYHFSKIGYGVIDMAFEMFKEVKNNI